jgi:hypothetical protein
MAISAFSNHADDRQSSRLKNTEIDGLREASLNDFPPDAVVDSEAQHPLGMVRCSVMAGKFWILPRHRLPSSYLSFLLGKVLNEAPSMVS